MAEQFISEAIHPGSSTFDTAPMARGEPGLPRQFTWRNRDFQIAQILQQWKEAGPCRSGANEIYLRKHWYRVITTDGSAMRIDFERQPRSRQAAIQRW